MNKLSKSGALENVSKAIAEFDIDKAKEMAEVAVKMEILAPDIVTGGYPMVCKKSVRSTRAASTSCQN